MKKKNEDHVGNDTEMLPEYDFREGVRGKHAKAYRQGHTVRIRKADRSIVEHHYSLEDGAVMLEPDVREYLSDSEAVNKALRSLITIVPRKRRARAKVG